MEIARTSKFQAIDVIVYLSKEDFTGYSPVAICVGLYLIGGVRFLHSAFDNRTLRVRL